MTEYNMYGLCLKEASIGRVPQQIEFFHAPLPDELAVKLVAAKQQSADEAQGLRADRNR
ncbi:MAG TPA: hypothetical protein VGQ36_24215 [Thermoanaerobaculia bacterium]|jgi:hypothetical protein|nr:hypothetical protein [Thermoanaerobaculia bacterium]